METLQDEVRRVDFEVPKPFSEVAFHPLGLSRRSSWPFPQNERQRLVMSPFLSTGFLERFASKGRGHVLISRADQLAAVGPAKLGGYGELYELDDRAEPEVADAQTTDASADPHEGARLQGLHAKLFVENDGHKARIWTGSANATNAAFNANVEFLVELRAGRWTGGIEAILGDEDSQTCLRALLRRVDPTTLVAAADKHQVAEDLIDAARGAIIGCDLTAPVAPGAREQTYSVSLRAARELHLPKDVGATARPLSLAHARALPLTAAAQSGEVARFDDVSYEGLSSFFAFDLTAKVDGQRATSSFVLNVPLLGAPEGRREAVLGKLLARKEDFLRFLLLLLAESGLDIPPWLVGPGAGGGSTGPLRGFVGSGQGLLELLLRALARDPGKLQAISDVVADLRASGHDDDFLPDGFEAVWGAIWTVGAHEARL